MNRDQLAHLLRAAGNATGQLEILVIGSQAILGTFDPAELPDVTTVSIEADLGILDDDDDQTSDLIDGVIGEFSPFHVMYGYYGQGISVTTAVLPDGWRGRLVLFETAATQPARGWCLEPHDLIIAKLVRGDPKDYDFADALVRVDAVHPSVLSDRLALTDLSDAVCARIGRWINAGSRG